MFAGKSMGFLGAARPWSNLSGLFKRQMDDGISIFLIKADRILLHQHDQAFVIGARTLHVVVTQPSFVEHPLECIVGITQCAVHGKRRRHIDLMLCMRRGKAILPIGSHGRLRTCRHQREAGEGFCEQCSKQYSASE